MSQKKTNKQTKRKTEKKIIIRRIFLIEDIKKGISKWNMGGGRKKKKKKTLVKKLSNCELSK
jgi:hypothetical protein